MITSFSCADTERIFNEERPRKLRLPDNLLRRALNKLRMIHASSDVSDLRVPPGNRLEKLKGDRSGYYSIRINDQWRICFNFKDGHASAVEIVDYH